MNENENGRLVFELISGNVIETFDLIEKPQNLDLIWDVNDLLYF